MISIQHLLAPVLAQVPASLLVLTLLAMSFILIFAGRTLVKVVAFLVVGFVGAAFGGTLAVQYLPPQWTLIGVLLGFLSGGLLGVALLPLGVGLAVGYAGYLFALDLALGPTAVLIAGIVSFVVGVLLSGKVLGVATAIVGGLLLFDVLSRYAGFSLTTATVVAALMTVVGLWIQLTPDRRLTQPPPTSVGGQPGDTH